jgi:hypothetical protein
VISRPSELFPKDLVAEFRRLAALPYPAAELTMLDRPTFQCRWLRNTWLRDVASTGADISGMIAAIAWFKEGPKIARASEEEYQALSRVEVRLELKDFTTPFPTMLVDLPPGHLHKAVLIHRHGPEILVCNSISHTFTDDICTVIRQSEEVMDASLGRFYDEITEDVNRQSLEGLRVACNLLLAMTSFGCKTTPIFPHEVVRDEKLARENSERGAKARDRLKEVPYEVKLDRTVVLYERQTGSHTEGEHTGRELSFHWRRGTWAMQPCGTGGKERKRIFRKPCMVRADLMIGSPADYTTTYK